MFPSLDYDPRSVPEPSEQQYLERIKEFIGDDTPAEILMRPKWYINEIVSKEYSKGNVIYLGDALHRHPPMNGLGSNTCLAWNVAYVMETWQSPRCLRRTRGSADLSAQASYFNDSYRNHRPIWNALGTLSSSVVERKAALEELTAAGSESGKALRAGRH